MRIKRTGSLFTTYRSSDGQTWTAIASDSVSMNDQVYVGIAVSSYSTTVPAAVVADSFTVTGPLPTGQQASDIGAPAIAGTTSYSNGVYQISAGGGDIWGTGRSVSLRLPTGEW